MVLTFQATKMKSKEKEICIVMSSPSWLLLPDQLSDRPFSIPCLMRQSQQLFGLQIHFWYVNQQRVYFTVVIDHRGILNYALDHA